MPVRDWSRRDVLRECLMGGLLLAPARWSEAEVLAAWLGQDGRKYPPTPHVEMGPFYKKRAPATTVLRAPGDPGLPLAVTGKVISVHGEPIAGARVEIWQANDGGLYDLDGYRYRARLTPGADGGYGFDSIMPGHYPARVARHVHYFVTAPGHKPLSTQLYFATDEVFQGDPDRNFSKDPLVTSRALVRPVSLTGAPGATVAAVQFELVLERA
jgi:protocatechuate 3,4-dioxygenase beta subunit